MKNMKNNKKFITLLEVLIREVVDSRNPLIEAPIQSQGEILIENRVRSLLKSTKEK